MIYLVILLLLLFLSIRYDINGVYRHKNLWYRIVLVAFILLAGLRWRLGVDTTGYLVSFYHKYTNLSIDDLSIGNSPLFVVINSFVRSLGGRFYVVQLIQATFVNVLIFIYIKKHSKYIFTCLFFYALFAFFNYNMEIMRGSMSIVICLFANDFIIERKWIKGYFLYFVALLFHPQTILLLVLPIFFFIRLNKVGFLFLIAAFIIGKIIIDLFGDYLFLFAGDEMLEEKVNSYLESDKFSIQGGNIGFYLATIFPLLFYPVVTLIFVKHFCPNSNLLKFEPFIMLGLAFSMVRMNVEIAYRYIYYYYIYFFLFYAEFFVELIKRGEKIDWKVAYLRSFSIFFPVIFLSIGYMFFSSNGQGFRYYPYTSVLNRQVDSNREMKFSSLINYNRPNKNEY